MHRIYTKDTRRNDQSYSTIHNKQMSLRDNQGARHLTHRIVLIGLNPLNRTSRDQQGADWGIRAQSPPTYFTPISAIPLKLQDVSHTEKKGKFCQGFAGAYRRETRIGKMVVKGKDEGGGFLSVLSVSRGTVEGHAPQRRGYLWSAATSKLIFNLPLAPPVVTPCVYCREQLTDVVKDLSTWVNRIAAHLSFNLRSSQTAAEGSRHTCGAWFYKRKMMWEKNHSEFFDFETNLMIWNQVFFKLKGWFSK